MACIGYVRASTLAQGLNVQFARLKADGCGIIRSEKVSGGSCENGAELATIIEFRVVESFAVSLAQDGAAVRAGLRLPWSSGQDEGQVNCLQLLKRSMYGRAKLDLLRRRFFLAA